jgi:acyl carrier protein
MSVETAVLSIISDVLYIAPNFNPEQTLVDDLGADSLDILNLVSELENHFDVNISDDDFFESMRAVHLVGVIEDLVDEKNNSRS